MGGRGSGRPREKTPVEQCRVISATELARNKMLGDGLYRFGKLTWRDYPGRQPTSVTITVKTIDPADAWLRLNYRINMSEEAIDYYVGLTTTPLPWGGVRWWFVCPLETDGKSCMRRCGKLYLPPDEDYFGCRICHDLTYESSQKAHRSDRLYAKLAAEEGMTLAMLKKLLKS